jgi:hypothetical protein
MMFSIMALRHCSFSTAASCRCLAWDLVRRTVTEWKLALSFAEQGNRSLRLDPCAHTQFEALESSRSLLIAMAKTGISKVFVHDNTAVLMAVDVARRDPHIFPSPEAYEPELWLPETIKDVEPIF